MPEVLLALLFINAVKPRSFEEICIASRTKSKCDTLKEVCENKYGVGEGKTKDNYSTQVDADCVDELVTLIEKVKH